jgi:hypothetical protein
MTTPTTFGRDRRYHDVTMELINPTPTGYHAATAEVAFADVLARYTCGSRRRHRPEQPPSRSLPVATR